MQRLSSFKYMCYKIFQQKDQMKVTKQVFDAFISHRGIDTKRNVALLLYDHLRDIKLQSFSDCESLNPGDKLFENIDMAVLQSKVGIAVFSAGYCRSYFCMYELALMFKYNKRIIPIYYDVKPHELEVRSWRSCPPEDMERFAQALEDVKGRVGIMFDTSTGDWSNFLGEVSDARGQEELA